MTEVVNSKEKLVTTPLSVNHTLHAIHYLCAIAYR